MDLSSSARGHLQPTGPELRQESSNRIDWNELSTEDIRTFLRVMEPAIVLSKAIEAMEPEEQRTFFERMGRYIMEEKQERAETHAILERAKWLIGWADLLDRVPDVAVTSGAAQPSCGPSVRQNVALVAHHEVAPQDVALEIPQNHHTVTVSTSVAAPTVEPSSVFVRAKKGADGFYHCGQCNYTARRSGTLRMHRFRKHRNPMK